MKFKKNHLRLITFLLDKNAKKPFKDDYEKYHQIPVEKKVTIAIENYQKSQDKLFMCRYAKYNTKRVAESKLKKVKLTIVMGREHQNIIIKQTCSDSIKVLRTKLKKHC